MQGHRLRSGTLWRRDVVVASEQQFPDVGEATVTLADASGLAARVAGRDPGTNVIALRLDGAADPPPLWGAEPRLGALAASFGADEAGISMALEDMRSQGPTSRGRRCRRRSAAPSRRGSGSIWWRQLRHQTMSRTWAWAAFPSVIGGPR